MSISLEKVAEKYLAAKKLSSGNCKEGPSESGYAIEFRLNGQFVIWESWAETGGMTDEQKKQVKEALGKYVSDEEFERSVSTAI